MADYQPYYPDSTNNLTLEWVMRQFMRLSSIIGNHVVHTYPSSETTGNRVGTTANSLADLQTMLDGNVFLLNEEAATPGGNLEFVFTNIRDVQGVAVRIFYSGSTSHHWAMALWNYVTSAWDVIRTIEYGYDFNYIYIEMPSGNSYHEGGEAQIQFHHPDPGNITHEFHIDYVAIVQQVAT